VVGRGFLMVNLWWDCGEFRGELMVVFLGLKNMPRILDLFFRDSHFGNGFLPRCGVQREGLASGERSRMRMFGHRPDYGAAESNLLSMPYGATTQVATRFYDFGGC
jgi:hypothetical protein